MEGLYVTNGKSKKKGGKDERGGGCARKDTVLSSYGTMKTGVGSCRSPAKIQSRKDSLEYSRMSQ